MYLNRLAKIVLLIIKIIFVTILLTGESYALVDYSSDQASNYNFSQKTSSRPNSNDAPASRSLEKVKNIQSNNDVKHSVAISPLKYLAIDFGSDYATIKTKNEDFKVSKYLVHARLQTPWNIYLDYYQFFASGEKSSYITNSDKRSQGNPEFTLGINWFKAGNENDLAEINILAGATPRTGNNDFASSRFDKHIGIETIKHFYSFALGLGYRYTISNAPKKNEELEIGGIQRFHAGIGWIATSDISFQIEGVHYKINKANGSPERITSENVSFMSKLQNQESFGVIIPRVLLQLSPIVELEMGGKFRTKKANDIENLLRARLWNLEGAYSNSIFAGLNVAL